MKDNSHLPLTNNALSYTWRELAKRAGVLGEISYEKGFADLGITLHYADPAEVKSDALSIIVIPCEDDNPKKILSAKDNSLDWISAQDVFPSNIELPFTDDIPVLFWGKGRNGKEKPFAEIKGKKLIFYADILAASFFMLSRWEEMVIPERDKHERFPASASVACKQSLLDRPVVDEYALILRTWLRKLVPNWQPKKKDFNIKLTHDIDHIRQFYPIKIALKVFRRGFSDPKSLLNFLFPSTDPFLIGLYRLADLAERYGYTNTAFYFLVDQPLLYGSHFNIFSRISKRCIADLQQRGFEIGFHSGYNTLFDFSRFRAEKELLDEILGEAYYGGRQHYLRFRVPETWRYWEKAGLLYDTSMGYAEREGFRCGTCHAFAPFDIEQDRELDLQEYPLIVMDGTLIIYRAYTPEEGLERTLLLANRCKRVEGTFTLLWHNVTFSKEGEAWEETYEKILKSLAYANSSVCE